MVGGLPQLLANLEEDGVLSLVQKRLEQGEDPMALVEECRAGMALVGERYEKGEYFLADLVMSSEIFKNAMSFIEPRLKDGLGTKSLGTVVIGTAQGDIHDIGKNIVTAMLRSSGFQVHDLGVDVPPQAFVDKVRETGAPLVGISVLLTTSFGAMKQTIEELRAAGSTRILVGGGPVNETVVTHVGADAWGKDAMEAVSLCKKFVGAVQ
jgi:5-methyltetrahydrofolate--homocysteine methyltransferase